MKKLKILVDLDGTLVDTMPAWLLRIYEKTGVMATLGDVTSWDIASCYPLNKLPREEIFSILNEPGFNFGLLGMPGAVSHLKQLHEAGHQIYLVTARFGPVAIPETIAWVKRELPWFDVEKRLCFLYDKSLIKADILIDDKAETLAAYREAHPKADLFKIDYPYNQSAVEGVYCVAYDGDAWTRFRQRVEVLAQWDPNERIH